MPSSAETHIQNTAPGPPMAIAPATPAMLPVPTVAASAVHTAWKGVMAPLEASPRLKMRPMVSRMDVPNLRIWMQRVRSVRYRPTPMIRIMAGTPQTKLFTALLTLVMKSSMVNPSGSRVVHPSEGQKKPRPHDACIRTEAVFRGTTLLCLHLAAQTFLSR